MSLPHFPKPHLDPKRHFAWYDLEEMREWKLEHERRLLSYVKFVEESGMILWHDTFPKGYEAKKKRLLGLNK